MSRDYLYRSVFRVQDSSSPKFGEGCDLSPMSSLTNILFEASLTPCKRLSLSSTLSDTPQSIHELTSSLTGLSDSFVFKENSLSCCEKRTQSPSRRLSSPPNKENVPTPYYSPSHGQIARHRISPLRDVQNTVNRNLSFSPLKKPVSPSKREHLSPVKNVSPTGDCDSNSRDSGYSESGQKNDGFNVPRLCAPTRRLNLDMSPYYSACKSPKEGKLRSFASFKKNTDEDALLLDFICGDSDEKQNESSSSFSSLLSAPIQSSLSTSGPPSNSARLPIRRCLSMVDNVTPLSSRTKKVDEGQDLALVQKIDDLSSPVSCCAASFKRPMKNISPSPMEFKRRKQDAESTDKVEIKPTVQPPQDTSKQLLSTRQLSNPETGPVVIARPKIQRCHSESHVSIMRALNFSSNHNGDLTGDFTQQLILPLVQGGKHPDLKSISVHTIADLMRGNFKDQIKSFKIIDCRYPYEYEGGHILNASNWHHPQMVLDHLHSLDSSPKIPTENSPRTILIFHCEFSAERGPKAQRLLRENDRTVNKEHYPALHFPELYLLEGGYKAFYESYPELCTPKDYIKMLDENHSEDLKFFRSKSKSWASEAKQSKSKCPIFRPGHKRLGL